MKMKTALGLFAAAAALAYGQEKSSEQAVKNVELTVYMLSGSQAPGDDVPADLASTVKQLHSLFTYKGYKLADSFIFRGRNALDNRNQNASTSGVLPGSGLHYGFSYQRTRVSTEKPYMIHIDGLSMALTTPNTYGPDGKVRYGNSIGAISTDLDLAEGQKTVVGKSSIDSAGNALILVIVPKVIE